MLSLLCSLLNALSSALGIATLLPGCVKPSNLKQTDSDSAEEIVVETRPHPVTGEIRRQPLAPRTVSSNALFQRVPAGQSGLDFVHHWAPVNNLQRDQIATAFAGGAVALGDIDNDGLPEIFLTRPHDGSRLYRNLGNFKFKDITEEVGIQAALADHWASGATFVDIQGDGRLDLYVCGYRSANKLFINTGTGSFVERAEQFGLDFAGASIMMSFVDYDRDGDLDAHLLTNRLSGQYRPGGLEFQSSTVM